MRYSWLILFAILVNLQMLCAEEVGTTEKTVKQVLVESAGLGSDLRDKVEEAGSLVVLGKNEKAQALITDLLTQMNTIFAEIKAKKSDKEVVFLSVSSDTQFDEFIAKNVDKKVTRVAWEVQKLLFLQAFIQAENGQDDQALATLDALLKIAPYASSAYCERGFILNRQGKFAEAVVSYQAASKLAEKFATERHNVPVALRGLGYSLTLQKKYEEARAAYQSSLEYESDNKIAMDAIAGIDKIVSSNTDGK